MATVSFRSGSTPDPVSIIEEKNGLREGTVRVTVFIIVKGYGRETKTLRAITETEKTGP